MRLPFRSSLRHRLRQLLHSSRTALPNPNSHNPWYEKWGQTSAAIQEPVSKRAVRFLTENAPEWLPHIARQRGERTEHGFWQSGSGYDRNMIQGQTLLAMIDDIHMNPVRRGLVAHAVDWKWSSAGWYVAGRTGPLRIDPIPADWLE